MLMLVKALAEPIMADRGRAHPSNLARVRSSLEEEQSGCDVGGINLTFRIWRL
jgi:hypothetical protein